MLYPNNLPVLDLMMASVMTTAATARPRRQAPAIQPGELVSLATKQFFYTG